METLTEQLVEALEAHLAGPWTVPGGAMKCGECRAYIKDGHQADCSWLLIARYRADPEALLRENGEAVRRTGKALMQVEGCQYCARCTVGEDCPWCGKQSLCDLCGVCFTEDCGYTSSRGACDRRTVSFPDLSCCWSSRKGTG